MASASWTREFKKGTIPLCLLTLISRGRMYGFEIIRTLRKRSDGYFDLKEGTVYPALHRLERQGLLSTEVVAQEGRPPRKYYSLTPAGETYLKQVGAEWERMVVATRSVLDE